MLKTITPTRDVYELATELNAVYSYVSATMSSYTMTRSNSVLLPLVLQLDTEPRV